MKTLFFTIMDFLKRESLAANNLSPERIGKALKVLKYESNSFRSAEKSYPKKGYFIKK